jgi:hypothetical protein
MAPRIDDYIRQRRNPFTGTADEGLDIERICPRDLWANTPYLRLRVAEFEEIEEPRGCRVGGPAVLAPGGMRFVAQLDLEELHRIHEGALDLPSEGYLALFLRPEPSATSFCEVRYADRLPPMGEPKVGRRLVPELRPNVDEGEEDEYEEDGDRLGDHRVYWARHPQGRPWIWSAIDLQLRQRSGGRRRTADETSSASYKTRPAFDCSGSSAPMTSSASTGETAVGSSC